MPKQIQALIFDTKKDGWDTSSGFTKRTIPSPALNERKDPADALAVIVKIRYAGVCGTDRGIWRREVFKELICNSLDREKKTSRILGHEFVGGVIARGSQVGNLYGITEGDDVSGDSHVTCGRCFQCHVGEEEVCQDQAILGVSTDGVFAQYVKLPAKNLWQVDFTRIRPEIAALFDPFGNAVHACSKVDLRGKRVLILGAGPIGMFTILLCRAFGAAKVIAADINERNLAMAERLGAHNTIFLSTPVKGASRSDRAKNARSPIAGFEEEVADARLAREINALTYNKGVDVSFEMAGPNASVVHALAMTRSGGDVILFGLKDGNFTLPHFNRIIIKGLTLHAVIGRQIFRTWQTSQRMLSDKKNGIQDAIWRIILEGGKDTIIPFASYTKEDFETKMAAHPKIIIRF